MQSVNLFPKLFDELDQKLKQLFISSYGISITTLEEVFLRVASLGAGHK
jgi:ATP-binding cassette subfamily A (ABC1) protein 3